MKKKKKIPEIEKTPYHPTIERGLGGMSNRIRDVAGGLVVAVVVVVVAFVDVAVG